MPISKDSMHRNEMSPSGEPAGTPRQVDSGTTPGGPSPTKKKTPDPLAPIRQVIANDPETLADSDPLGPDTLSPVSRSASGSSSTLTGMSIGGFSLTTVLLIVLFLGVGYLLIKAKGK